MNDQNERRLETLSGQVSSLKNVTYDIYSRANDYTRIDRAVCNLKKNLSFYLTCIIID